MVEAATEATEAVAAAASSIYFDTESFIIYAPFDHLVSGRPM